MQRVLLPVKYQTVEPAAKNADNAESQEAFIDIEDYRPRRFIMSQIYI